MKPFAPKFMKVGILTAALQELTPRAVRDMDPDRAIEDWLAFAGELGSGHIQLSAALHPSETDVPPEAMLDPVANTLDLRRPFDKERARRVEAALRSTAVGLSDLAYFDNLLHHDPATRKKKHDFLMRVFDAAVETEASRWAAQIMSALALDSHVEVYLGPPDAVVHGAEYEQKRLGTIESVTRARRITSHI